MKGGGLRGLEKDYHKHQKLEERSSRKARKTRQDGPYQLRASKYELRNPNHATITSKALNVFYEDTVVNSCLKESMLDVLGIN